MSTLNCKKKLESLDSKRDVVQFFLSDLKVAYDVLVESYRKASFNNDPSSLRALPKQAQTIKALNDSVARMVDEWEAMAKEFRKEVLDAVLDKVKREKNQKELATICVSVKDYVEASEEEIKEARSVISKSKFMSEAVDGFAKAMSERAAAPTK